MDTAQSIGRSSVLSLLVLPLIAAPKHMARYKIEKPELPEGESLSIFGPNQLPWERFEQEVAAHFEREIARESLGFLPGLCKVIEKPEYYSKTRESNITFDVSVEVRPLPNSEEASLIWIIECKDYPSRKVGVDEIEEFAEKMRQVGAHKGTIATRKGFQSGALAVAKTYRIGLMTLNKCICVIHQLSADGTSDLDVALVSPMTIRTSGEQRAGDSTYLSQIIFDEIGDLWPPDDGV